jgi:lysophospholipase L1-like esterase
VLLVVGHSWVAGSDGTDAQYNGRALPPGVTWRQSGVVRTAWTSTPSVLPYLVDHMVRPSVVISRGVGSSDVDDWTTTHWPAAVADVTAAGAGAPDMVVLWLGGNDAGSPAEVANFATKYPTLLTTIETAYPSATLVLVQDARIDLDPGGIGPYIVDIRAVIAAEAGPGRVVVDAAAEEYEIQPSGHPYGGVGEGYDDVAHLIVEQWQ